jgi:heterodisulfide reductase subunit B
MTDIVDTTQSILVAGSGEAAYDAGANMIVTPCPRCQANVEVLKK